jgi:hypothetical protein
VFRQLLDDATLKGDELDRRVANAVDRSYWRRVSPAAHIEDPSASLLFEPADDAAIAAAIAAIRLDGIFHLDRVVTPETVTRLNALVDTVTAQGWPPAFVFVYDEPWLAARSPAAMRLAREALGPGFGQISRPYVNIVQSHQGAHGWTPHVDGEHGGRLTTWLPLTEVTLYNGCMHAVPRTFTAPGVYQRFQGDGTFTKAEVMRLLQGTRALPAAAGDILGWPFDIIHWGGPQVSGVERRSLSFEFIGAHEHADAHELPVLDVESLPPFELRVRLVGRSLERFQEFEPTLARFAPLAGALQAR